MPNTTVESIFIDGPDSDNYFLAVEKIKRLLLEGIATNDMSRINLTLTGVHTNFHYVPMTVTRLPEGLMARYETFATAEKTPHTTLPVNIRKDVIDPYLKSAGNEHHGLQEHSHEANTIVMANVLHQLLADVDIADLVASNPGILQRLRLIQGKPIHDYIGHTTRSRADYYPSFTKEDGKIKISTRTPEEYDAYVGAQHDNSYVQRVDAGMLATELAYAYLEQETSKYGIEYLDGPNATPNAFATMFNEYSEAKAIRITLAGPLTALADEHQQGTLTDEHLTKAHVSAMLLSQNPSLNIFGDNYNLVADPEAAEHVMYVIFPKLPLGNVVCIPTDAFKGEGNPWAQMLKSTVEKAAEGKAGLGIGPEMAKLYLLYAKSRAWNYGLNQIQLPVQDEEGHPVMEHVLEPVNAQGEAVMQVKMRTDSLCPYLFDLALVFLQKEPTLFALTPCTYERVPDKETGQLIYQTNLIASMTEADRAKDEGKMVVLLAHPDLNMAQQPNALSDRLNALWKKQSSALSASVSESTSAGSAHLGIFGAGAAAAAEPASKRQHLGSDSAGYKS